MASIQYKMLSIAILLVSIPTIVVGFLSYRTFSSESYRNIENDLKLIVSDWRLMTQGAMEENDKILRREEVLVEQRLRSIVLDVKKMLTLHAEQFGNDLPRNRQSPILQTLREINIGRSGFVALIDRKGNYLVSGQKNSSDTSVFETCSLAVNDTDKLIDKLNNVRNSAGDDAYTLAYSCHNTETAERMSKLAIFAYFVPWDTVIAAVIHYTDFKSYELTRQLQNEIKYKMAEQHIGKNGYIWAMDSKGNYVVSKDRLRDGENIIDSDDDDSNRVIREIVNTATRLKPGEPIIRYYSWRNIGETRPRYKVSAFTYMPEWDWIIAASAYQDDFLKGLRTITYQIVGVCIICMIIGSAIAYIFIAFLIRPIKRLEYISQVAAGGDLSVRVDEELISRKDEVGTLSYSFDTMIAALSQKIKELIVAKEESEESERKFRTIFNQAAAGVTLTDMVSGELIEANKTYCDITGYSKQQLISTSFHEYTHSDDLRADLDKLEEMKMGKIDFYSMEKRYIRPDGSIVWVNLTVSPIREDNRQAEYYVSIIQDITRRKSLESQVKILQGIIPICSSCKKIRDDKGYWSQIEKYISTHTDADFSHSICPDCAEKLYKNEPWFKKSDYH